MDGYISQFLYFFSVSHIAKNFHIFQHSVVEKIKNFFYHSGVMRLSFQNLKLHLIKTSDNKHNRQNNYVRF